MYCKVVILGNLTKDIEIKNTQSGLVVGKTSIAYTDGWGEKKKTHFIDVTMWNKVAEIANQYLHRGSKVLLEGVICQESWTAQDGTNRSKHSLRVDTMKMLDGKPKEGEEQRGEPPKQDNYSYEDEDEIPF